MKFILSKTTRGLISPLLLALSSIPSMAQHQFYVGLAPFGIFSKLAVSTEFPSKKGVHFGSVLTYNYGTVWVGPKAEASLRYYFAKQQILSSSDGMYLILQPGVASYKTPYAVRNLEKKENSVSILYPLVPQLQLAEILTYTDDFSYLKGQRTTASGVGLGLGYKKVIKNYFFDFNIRFQAWKTQPKQTLRIDNKLYIPYDGSDRASFTFYGPGSIIAPMLIVGWQIK